MYFITILNRLVILTLIGVTEGRIFHNEIKVNNRENSHLPNEQSENTSQIEKLMTWNFGFIKGGTSDFYMKCPKEIIEGSNIFHMLYCEADESRKLEAELGGTSLSLAEICPTPDGALHADAALTDTMHRHQGLDLCNRHALIRRKYAFEVLFSKFYTIYLLHCQAYSKDKDNGTAAVICQATLSAMNPSGVHLSSDEIYIPLIYALCSIVWAFLIVIWAVNAMIYYKVCSVTIATVCVYKSYKCVARNRELLTRRRRRMRRFVLKHQLRCTRRYGVDQQLVGKLNVYARLRPAAASFACAYGVAAAFFSFAANYAYVEILVMEGLQLYLYVCIGYVFRLRCFHDYECVELAVPIADVAVIVMPIGRQVNSDRNTVCGVALACPVSCPVAKSPASSLQLAV